VRDSTVEGANSASFYEPLSGCSVFVSQIKDNDPGILMWDSTSGTIANDYPRNAGDRDARGIPESTPCNTMLTRTRNIVGGRRSGGNYWHPPETMDTRRSVSTPIKTAYASGRTTWEGYMDNFTLAGPVKGRIRNCSCGISAALFKIFRAEAKEMRHPRSRSMNPDGSLRAGISSCWKKFHKYGHFRLIPLRIRVLMQAAYVY